MKRIVYIILSFSLLACEKSEEPTQKRTPMRIRFVDQLAVVDSRAMTEYTTANLSEIGLYVWQTTAEYNYENCKLGKCGAYWELTDGGDHLYWDDIIAGSMATIVAYAPYSYNPDDAGYIEVSVTDDHDFVYGVKNIDVDNAIANGGVVTMELSHLFAKIKIVAKSTNSNSSALLELRGIIKNAQKSVKLNTQDGTVVPLYTFDFETEQKIDSCVGYILPQLAEKITIVINEKPYEIDLPSNGISTFESNHSYIFTIHVGDDFVHLAEDFDVTVSAWISDQTLITDLTTRIIYNQGTLWAADAESLQLYVTTASEKTVADTLQKISKLVLRGNPSIDEWNFISTLVKDGHMPMLTDLKFTDITTLPNIWHEIDADGARWLKSISLPNVTTIEDKALRGCLNLKTVDMPKLETIGNQSFSFCCSLENVSFENVTSLGDCAFYNCPLLATVYFPRVTTVGDSCFYVNDETSNHVQGYYLATEYQLKNVYMPLTQHIGVRAFCKTPLKNISLPSAIEIGAYAFYGAISLATVSLDAVTSIGDYAFCDCPLRYMLVGGDETMLGLSVFTSTEIANATLNLKTATTNAVNVSGNSWKSNNWNSILLY